MKKLLMGRIFSSIDLKLATIIGALSGILAVKFLPVLTSLSYPHLIVAMFLGCVILDLKLLSVIK